MNRDKGSTCPFECALCNRNSSFQRFANHLIDDLRIGFALSVPAGFGQHRWTQQQHKRAGNRLSVAAIGLIRDNAKVLHLGIAQHEVMSVEILVKFTTALRISRSNFDGLRSAFGVVCVRCRWLK